MAALLADQYRCAPIRPIQAKECHAGSVQLGLALCELIVLAMGTQYGLAKLFVRHDVFSHAPKMRELVRPGDSQGHERGPSCQIG